MCHSLVKSVLTEAHRLGLQDVHVDRTRRHPHLRASLPAPGAPAISYAFPGTPSDWRSEQNAVHQLRRIVRRESERRGLAVPGSPSKPGRPRSRPFKRKPKTKSKEKVVPVPRPLPAARPRAEAAVSPWAKLAALREALIAAERVRAEEPNSTHNLLYAGAAARARRNGQW